MTLRPFSALCQLAFGVRIIVFAILFVGLPIISTGVAQTTSRQSEVTTFEERDGGGEPSVLFQTIQGKTKGLSIVFLLIMLVFAAVMAAVQKTGMAISVAIGAIILFGSVWVLKLIQAGIGG